MTKKFWKDWQNRIGETKNIILANFVTNPNNGRTYYVTVLQFDSNDKILKANFHGDAVDLVIERHWYTKKCHYTTENEYLTLHRNDIETIEFYKY